MKKNFTIAFLLFLSVYFINAQTVIWSDDFETYADGSGVGSLGQNFAGWDGTTQVWDGTLTGHISTTHSGTKYVSCTRGNTQYQTAGLSKTLTLTEGKSYIFSAWVKTPSTGATTYTIKTNVKLGSSAWLAGTETSPNNGNVWVKLSQSFTVGVSQTTVIVAATLYTPETAKKLHIDDMAVIAANNISVTRNENAYGTVVGSGIIATGSTASLTATANSGYHFVNWTENGSEVSTNVNYSFTASTDRTLVANFEPDVLPVNSGIINAADITCTTCDVTVAAGAELTVGANKTLKSVTVAAGGKLTVSNGILSTNNGITLQNTAGGTASFVDERTDDSPSPIAGTVEQAITDKNRNWYVAIPVTGQEAADITLSGASIVERDEINGEWDDVTGSLIAGKGYIAVASATGGSATWTLAGNLNSGKVEVAVTKSGTGFNLLGNPYPSYLNWEQVLSLNATNASVLQGSIWYRTATYSEAQSKFNYTFNTYNSTSRIATPLTTSGYIPPMQAFWVRANNAGTVTFTNAMRSHGNGASNKLQAPKAISQKIVRLQVENTANITDETVVYFNNNAQNSLDKYDSEKMFDNTSSKPEIFTLAGAEKLVINGLNTVQYNTEIPLGFSTLTAGNFSISRTELSNFESGTRILLKDKLYPTTEFELAEGASYNFSAGATAASTDRFSLLFRAPGVTTGIEKAEKLNAQVFVNAANQIVIVAPAKSNYAIYNAMGQQIENGQTNTKHEIRNTKLQTGVYVVKVGNHSTRVIVK